MCASIVSYVLLTTTFCTLQCLLVQHHALPHSQHCVDTCLCAACPRLELEAHDAVEPAMDKRDKIRLMDSKMVRIKNGEVDMDDLNPE